MKKPELLAPAGNMEVLKHAIKAGADAVYCAGKSFGARAFAGNFTNDEIIEASEYVHLHLKKIYITVNTLVFESEFALLKEYIDFLYQHVDGVIVQDLGVFHYVRKTYPDFPVHMSTQCNIHNVQDSKIFKNLGSTRLVLSRETPLDVVKEIINLGIEVELFVHGALCFSYSGNCFMSYKIGGRSGNRGSCAQPCRKNYQLIEDDKVIKTGPLLSMKDLMTLKNIPLLCDLGVASFKIEGRMKNIEYVVSTIKAYRKAIDDWDNKCAYKEDKKLINNMLVTFNRGFTKGYLFNASNNEVTTPKFVNHQGIQIGIVTNYFESKNSKQVEIKLDKSLSLNDGIRIGDEGLLVTRIFQNKQMVKKAEDGYIIIDVKNKIPKGSIVLKTSDSELSKSMDNVLKDTTNNIIISGYFIIKQDKLSFEIKNSLVNVKTVLNVNLDKAIKEVNYDRIKEQLIKSGNVPIQYKNIKIIKDSDYFIPIPLLNQIRQETLNKWIISCCNIKERIFIPYLYNKKEGDKSQNKLLYLCRNNNQIKLVKEKNKSCYNILDLGKRINFNNTLEIKKYAYRLSEIGLDSDISPYFNICNKEGIEFIRCFTNGIIYLGIETPKEDLNVLIKEDKNLGILVYSKIPLMVSNHCVVANSKEYVGKNCLECFKHKYQILDSYNNKMNLYFENCTMYILGYDHYNIISEIKNDPLYGSLNLLIELYNEEELPI